MNTPNIIFEKTLLINTFECDVNHQWKPAAMFQHLTETAFIHASKLGVGFQEMLAKNLYWVHSRMKIKFFKIPRAQDIVTIRTWPKTIQQKLFYIRDFEVLDETGTQLAVATSAWVVINATTRRMVMPQSLDFDLPSLPDRSGLIEPLEKLVQSRSGDEKLRVKAGYSAVDILGHVNNSRYVEWICDAFPLEQYRQRSLDWIQINYEREIMPDEEVAILSAQSTVDSNQWSMEGINKTSGLRSFEAMLEWK